MKINPKQMEKMMKQMGIQTQEIPAEEVIIKSADKELVITNPQISKVSIGGQETYQIIGEAVERATEKFSSDDIQMIVDQTNCSEEEAKKALEETEDIAEAILKLKSVSN